jgi:hypothetical protein
LISLRKKYDDKPIFINEIKIPQKNEIRSRAKILTDEAFRETRNYLDIHKDVKNPQSRDFLNNFYKKIALRSKKQNKEINADENTRKVSLLREILNKISFENYYNYCDQILKFSYDEVLLENFKVIKYIKKFYFLFNTLNKLNIIFRI